MESKNTKVLEALQMQPLSEEEKARRHILGRLWGPIATSKEKTRNGRGYNAELWRKALADEIFCEKVANKSLFLELGHPIDREETDMRMVCACIPELPKVIDGDLYAYVDILDTKDGRLLKTLCDYGFIPGISSRGSGDIMANDDVDPETFFLETWDIVQLPAVKKARLAVCESLSNKKTLSTALRESLAEMTDDDRKEAKATLERLGVEYGEEPYADIPWAADEEPLLEDTEEIEPVLEPIDAEEESSKEEETEEEEVKPEEEDKLTEAAQKKYNISYREGGIKKSFTITASSKEEAKQIAWSRIDAEDIWVTELDEELEESADTDEVEVSDEEVDKKEIEETDEESGEETDLTIGTLVDNFSEFDKDLAVEFDPIEIDNNILTITEVVLDDEEEGKVKISFNYNLETSDNKEADEESEADEEESSPEDDQLEADTASEEAIDDGNEEVIESLKEMVRQKDALEEEVLSLKSRQTFSDAEVERLKEELQKYKTGFMRVSELASKSNKLQKEVTSLTEQLNAKDETIRGLENKAKIKLTEGLEKTNKEVKTLQERLITMQNEAEATEQELREQVEAARKNTREATTVAKAYKQKYVAVVEHYIASKATMLGVSTRDITSKLHEGYTLEDVDQVCETLLTAGRPAFGLGIGAQGTPKIKLKESVTQKQYTGGYDIDDDLLELAGLK